MFKPFTATLQIGLEYSGQKNMFLKDYFNFVFLLQKSRTRREQIPGFPIRPLLSASMIQF
jgi:hypothetical protein